MAKKIIEKKTGEMYGSPKMKKMHEKTEGAKECMKEYGKGKKK